jgi:hypothetical protein
MMRLEGVAVRTTLDWTEELNGWTSRRNSLTVRIEKVDWGVVDPKPAPV